MYTAEVLQKVVSVARAAAEAHARGQATYQAGGQTFDLDAGGWCLRFVRQVWEVALGIGAHDWQFDSPSAKVSLGMMDGAGLNIGKPAAGDLRPGDVLGMKTDAGTFGHIMLYLGEGAIAENTSAGNRGTPRQPGTKISLLGDVWERVQGVYRLGEWAGWQVGDPPGPLPLFKLPELVRDAGDLIAV